MFTAAESRAKAAEKLLLAEHNARHRRKYLNASQAWLDLAGKLDDGDAKRLFPSPILDTDPGFGRPHLK